MIATTKPASLGTWEFITEPVDFCDHLKARLRQLNAAPIYSLPPYLE
jgi:hypothetical protein